MNFEDLHAPGEGTPKNLTQTISMVVGGLLFILCLNGIMNPRFAGLNLSLIYSLVAGFAGVSLFYSGYKNYSRHAYNACLGFGIFFLLYGILGYVIGGPTSTEIALVRNENLYRVFPDFRIKSMADHILNGIIGFVLLGGAIDWKRRERQYGSLERRRRSAEEQKNTQKKFAHR